MANLKDVAKLAGVAISTASQALNGKSIVNEGTRKKVLECAKKLNYVPNRGGQSLITGKSNTIHLIIFNSQKHPDFVAESTFFYKYIMGILLEAQKRNYNFTMEIKVYEDPDLDEYFRVKCSDKSADGIILVPQYVQNYSFLSYLADIPHVILNPCVKDSRINTVTVDHRRGGEIVAEEFVNKGYERIGVIHGPDDHSDALDRKAGFMGYLQKKNIYIPDELQYVSDFTSKSGYSGIKTILGKQKKLEAIFCCNDFVAAGVIRYLSENNIKIPDDIAVIGYDNVDISKNTYPEITTVNGKLLEVGSTLADALFAQITDAQKNVNMTIIPEIVYRESLKK